MKESVEMLKFHRAFDFFVLVSTILVPIMSAQKLLTCTCSNETVADPEGVQGVRSNPLTAPVFKIPYENEIIWSQ